MLETEFAAEVICAARKGGIINRGVLYVGYRADTREGPIAACQGVPVYCIEPHEANIGAANVSGLFSGVYRGTVQEHAAGVSDEYVREHYDALVWLHGPEHVRWVDFCKTAAMMEPQMRFVLYQAPEGEYPQGAYRGNPFEQHLATLHAETFLSRGYCTCRHLEQRTFTAWRWSQ